MSAFKLAPENLKIEPLLNADEVATILGMSRSFVYKLVANGDIPSIRMGRSVRIDPYELRKFCEKNTKRSINE